jgi:hypothetical protein
MLANISVGHDIHISETIQMFSAAWRTLSATTNTNYFHKEGAVLQEWKSKTDSDSDMVNNGQ